MKLLLVLLSFVLSTALVGCSTLKEKQLYRGDESAEINKPRYTYVVMTGSRIPRKVDLNNIDEYTAQPIDVISGETIRNTMMRK